MLLPLRQALTQLSRGGFVKLLASDRLRMDSNGLLLRDRLLALICQQGKPGQQGQNTKKAVEVLAHNGSLHEFFARNKASNAMCIFSLAPKTRAAAADPARDLAHFQVSISGEEILTENETSLKTLMFFREKDWKFLYQEVLSSRRKFWKHWLNNPWGVCQEGIETSRIGCTFEDQEFGPMTPLVVETTRVLHQEKGGIHH